MRLEHDRKMDRPDDETAEHAAVVHPGTAGRTRPRQVSLRWGVPSDAGEERPDDLRPPRRQASAVEAVRIDHRVVDLPDVRQVRVWAAARGPRAAFRHLHRRQERPPARVFGAVTERPERHGSTPPSSMFVGDNWIAKEVNAIEASPDWPSTAIFITYDD